MVEKLFDATAEKKGLPGLYVIGILILLGGLVGLISMAGFYAGIGVFADLMGLLSVFGFELTLVGGIVGLVAGLFFLIFGAELAREKKWAYWVYHAFIFIGLFLGGWTVYVGQTLVGVILWVITIIIWAYLRWIAIDVSPDVCEEGKFKAWLACSRLRGGWKKAKKD